MINFGWTPDRRCLRSPWRVQAVTTGVQTTKGPDLGIEARRLFASSFARLSWASVASSGYCRCLTVFCRSSGGRGKRYILRATLTDPIARKRTKTTMNMLVVPMETHLDGPESWGTLVGRIRVLRFRCRALT